MDVVYFVRILVPINLNYGSSATGVYFLHLSIGVYNAHATFSTHIYGEITVHDCKRLPTIPSCLHAI